MQIEVTIPDGQSGKWRIDTIYVSQEEANLSAMRAAITGRRHERVEPGHYKRLRRGSTVVMSNTPMEIATHRDFIRKATGHVLINGLGLGMALSEILKKPHVLSVTVIELSPDVIKLVGPHFESDQRVKIINADCMSWQPEQNQKFDVIWHDIWDDITPENLGEMSKLHRKFARRCSWQGSWAKDTCQSMRKEHAAWEKRR